MTDPSYTAVCLVVDRSHSMRAILEGTEEGVNGYIEQLRQPGVGRTTIRIVQFDGPEITYEDWYTVVCPSTPVADAPKFQLDPRGNTALYDAIARAIDEFGSELARMEERQRPGTVIFAIMTDGKENASTTPVGPVRERVERQQDQFAWKIVYLGANQDAVLEGGQLGVPRHSSMTFGATDRNTGEAAKSLGTYTASAASGGQAAFTDDDRQRAMQQD